MELMDACAPWPKLMQVLRSKGLPAFHDIEPMFALRELLNEQLSLCDKGLFHEVPTRGNISKLGPLKKMHEKFLITHGMLRRLWEVIDTDWLEKEGEILFDLERWEGGVLLCSWITGSDRQVMAALDSVELDPWSWTLTESSCWCMQ